MIARILLLMAMFTTGTAVHAQDDETMSTQQQVTLMQYAGPDSKPLVPVAIKRSATTGAAFAANWLAGRRKQTLLTYSFNPKSDKYFGKDSSTIAAVFKKAEDGSAILYFEDAEQWFGAEGITPEIKALATQFLQLSKKPKCAVLVQCLNDNSWYALAKGGFGILDLNIL